MTGTVLAKVSDVPAAGQGALELRVADTPIGIFRVGEEIVAWRNVCPHAAAPVCRGVVGGTLLTSKVYEYKYGRHQEVVQCPWHGWEFDLIDGRHLAEGSSVRLRSYPIRVSDGLIYDMTPLNRVDLTLQVESVMQETERILVVDLSSADGSPLPAWTPGTHIEVVLPSGRIRHYSLCGDPRDRHRYRIAVLLEADGTGGSQEFHDMARIGAHLRVSAIRNRFPLSVAKEYILIAGGIGITPLLPMIAALQRRKQSFQVIYTGRVRESMAFADTVSALGRGRIVETSREYRVDLKQLVRDADPGTAIFACGPAGLLEDLRDAVAATENPLDLHIEAFQSIASSSSSAPADLVDREFEVHLERQRKSFTVPPGQSILKTLRDAGHSVPSSCEDGWCGTCETPVLSGVIEHRDTVLSEDEHDSGATMMICVSRAQSDALVLDL